jgi:hypothetical protein
MDTMKHMNTPENEALRTQPRGLELYRRVEMPPEPWTHEDNPEWIFVVSQTEPYMLVEVVPDEILLIGKYGYEGVPMDRAFSADSAGETASNNLEQGKYAVIRIGDWDGGQ